MRGKHHDGVEAEKSHVKDLPRIRPILSTSEVRTYGSRSQPGGDYTSGSFGSPDGCGERTI
jgi:hypothetical protein